MDKDQRASKTRPAQPDKAIETETQNRLEMFQSVSALFAAACCCVSFFVGGDEMLLCDVQSRAGRSVTP